MTEPETEEDTIIRMFSASLLYMDGQYCGWAPSEDLSPAAAEAFKSELSRLLAEPLFRRYAEAIVRVESDTPEVDSESQVTMATDTSVGIDARLGTYRAALASMRSESTSKEWPEGGRWAGTPEFCAALEGLLAMPGVRRCVDAILYVEYIESYFRYLDDMDWLREVGHPLAGMDWTWTPKEVMDERIEAWEREHPEPTGNRE